MYSDCLHLSTYEPLAEKNIPAADFSKFQSKRKTEIFLQIPDKIRIYGKFENSTTGTFSRPMAHIENTRLQGKEVL